MSVIENAVGGMVVFVCGFFVNKYVYKPLTYFSGAILIMSARVNRLSRFCCNLKNEGCFLSQEAMPFSIMEELLWC